MSKEKDIDKKIEEIVERKIEEKLQEKQSNSATNLDKKIDNKLNELQKTTITEKNNSISRRSFLKSLGLGAGILGLSASGASKWINVSSQVADKQKILESITEDLNVGETIIKKGDGEITGYNVSPDVSPVSVSPGNIKEIDVSEYYHTTQFTVKAASGKSGDGNYINCIGESRNGGSGGLGGKVTGSIDLQDYSKIKFHIANDQNGYTNGNGGSSAEAGGGGDGGGSSAIIGVTETGTEELLLEVGGGGGGGSAGYSGNSCDSERGGDGGDGGGPEGSGGSGGYGVDSGGSGGSGTGQTYSNNIEIIENITVTNTSTDPSGILFQ